MQFVVPVYLYDSITKHCNMITNVIDSHYKCNIGASGHRHLTRVTKLRGIVSIRCSLFCLNFRIGTIAAGVKYHSLFIRVFEIGVRSMLHQLLHHSQAQVVAWQIHGEVQRRLSQLSFQFVGDFATILF